MQALAEAQAQAQAAQALQAAEVESETHAQDENAAEDEGEEDSEVNTPGPSGHVLMAWAETTGSAARVSGPAIRSGVPYDLV